MTDFPELLPFLRTPDTISSCKYLGMAAARYRARAGGTEPFLFPGEGIHVDQQFVPFMMEPPAVRVVDTSGYGTVAILPAKVKTRYLLRNWTAYCVCEWPVGAHMFGLYLQADVDGTGLDTVDFVMGSDWVSPTGYDILECHTLNLMTWENTAVRVIEDETEDNRIAVRYSEVQVL